MSFRLLIVSHSLIHPRQYLFVAKLREMGVDVLEVYPKEWGSLKRKDGFDVHSAGNIYGYSFQMQPNKLHSQIARFEPEIILSWMEPCSAVAKQFYNIARLHKAKFVCFTWENIKHYFPQQHQEETEKLIINKADLIICGNDSAKNIMDEKGANNTVVLPQVGVDTDLFRPLPDIQKRWDVLFVGRATDEKGVTFIKQSCRELQKSLVIVSHTSYLNLPRIYNRARVFCSYPFEIKGWKPQFEYTLAETLACGIPVVTSNAGAIPEIYGHAPGVSIIPQRNNNELSNALETALRIYEGPCQAGRDWVVKNISSEVIASKLIDHLNIVLGIEAPPKLHGSYYRVHTTGHLTSKKRRGDVIK